MTKKFCLCIFNFVKLSYCIFGGQLTLQCHDPYDHYKTLAAINNSNLKNFFEVLLFVILAKSLKFAKLNSRKQKSP